MEQDQLDEISRNDPAHLTDSRIGSLEQFVKGGGALGTTNEWEYRVKQTEARFILASHYYQRAAAAVDDEAERLNGLSLHHAEHGATLAFWTGTWFGPWASFASQSLEGKSEISDDRECIARYSYQMAIIRAELGDYLKSTPSESQTIGPPEQDRVPPRHN